jgi:hypothetical protein
MGVGSLPPALHSSGFHYVWQRLGLCVLKGSGLSARRGPACSWLGWGCFTLALSICIPEYPEVPSLPIPAQAAALSPSLLSLPRPQQGDAALATV